MAGGQGDVDVSSELVLYELHVRHHCNFEYFSCSDLILDHHVTKSCPTSKEFTPVELQFSRKNWYISTCLALFL